MNKQYIHKLLEDSHQKYISYHQHVPIRQYEQPSDFKKPNLLLSMDDIEIRVHNPPSWAGIEEPNTQPVYPHYHQFFELVYVYQGAFYNSIEEDRFVLHSDQLVLITPDKIHAPFTKYEDDIVINVLIKPQVVEQHLCQLFPKDNMIFRFFFHYLYNVNTTVSHLVLSMSPKIEQILEMMIQEYCDKSFLYQQSLEFLSCSLFVELARSYHLKEQKKHVKRSDFPLEEIIEYIQDHYATVTLKELSQQFFYSIAYICKMLKEKTGKNFHDILLQCRLENACYLLKNTSLSIKDINDSLGFQDSSYLGKIFSKKYHMTLSEYRKSVQ